MEWINSRPSRYKLIHITLTGFNIINVGTIFDGRIFELRITAGENYPNVPPKVRFVNKINLTCVDQSNGNVGGDLPSLQQWNRNMSIEQVLVDIRKAMNNPNNKRSPQPPEGANYPM